MRTNRSGYLSVGRLIVASYALVLALCLGCGGEDVTDDELARTSAPSYECTKDQCGTPLQTSGAYIPPHLRVCRPTRFLTYWTADCKAMCRHRFCYNGRGRIVVTANGREKLCVCK